MLRSDERALRRLQARRIELLLITRVRARGARDSAAIGSRRSAAPRLPSLADSSPSPRAVVGRRPTRRAAVLGFVHVLHRSPMLPLTTRAPMPDDVVEAFLQSHAFARSMLSLAERLASAQADESTAAAAQRVATFFTHHLEVHFADEESSLAPRIQGRHKVIDQALAAMRLEHVQLHALICRVAFLCQLVAKDAPRLMTLRFELAGAVEHLRRCLESHQAREESMLFPAVRRLLDWEDVEEMRAEMALRRAPGVELSEAAG